MFQVVHSDKDLRFDNGKLIRTHDVQTHGQPFATPKEAWRWLELNPIWLDLPAVDWTVVDNNDVPHEWDDAWRAPPPRITR